MARSPVDATCDVEPGRDTLLHNHAEDLLSLIELVKQREERSPVQDVGLTAYIKLLRPLFELVIFVVVVLSLKHPIVTIRAV